jgi:hypothetical protein
MHPVGAESIFALFGSVFIDIEEREKARTQVA